MKRISVRSKEKREEKAAIQVVLDSEQAIRDGRIIKVNLRKFLVYSNK